VTAGNASGINDAAAAVVLMSGERTQRLGVPVRGRIVSHAVWSGASGSTPRGST